MEPIAFRSRYDFGPKICDQRTLIRVTESVAPITDAVIKSSRAFIEFSKRICEDLELLYKQEHGKLPGSMKTTRLRKKRRMRVLVWFRRKRKQVGDEKMMELLSAVLTRSENTARRFE